MTYHSPGWPTLKGLLKKSPTLVSLVYRLRGIRFVDRLEDLDRILGQISKKYPAFNDEAIAAASKICYRFKNLNLPEDDSSPEYARRQLDLYKYFSDSNKNALNGREQQLDTKQDRVGSTSQDGHSSWEAERQSIMAGTILRRLTLPQGSRIVELGAGCGDVTRELAAAGYEVTAVEIDGAYVEQIRSRTEGCEKEVRIIHQDMLEFVRGSSDRFDAALFVGSFHHCLEHVELLKHLSGMIQENGIICFANEPVFLAENPFLPYPWGVRLDGQSLYFMRRHGWLELGFQSSYLKRILSDFGWNMERRPSGTDSCPDIILATRE